MQPHPARQPTVDEWLGVVQASARGGCQPDREPADRLVVDEAYVCGLQSGAAVHEHRVRAVDEHVRDSRFPQ